MNTGVTFILIMQNTVAIHDGNPTVQISISPTHRSPPSKTYASGIIYCVHFLPG